MNKEAEKVIYSFNKLHKDRKVTKMMKIGDEMYILEAPKPGSPYTASLFAYSPKLGTEKNISPTENIREFREIMRRLVPVEEL